MNRHTDEIVGLVAAGFRCLRRSCAKYLLHIERLPFQHDIRSGKSADVAASAGKRHPWPGNVQARGRGQRKRVVQGGRGNVRNQVRPIEKGRREERRAGRSEIAKTVGDEDARVIGIQPGLRGENSIGSVRDKDGVIPSIKRAILLYEVQQVGHLFQVGWNVGIVAREVHVIEFHVHHMLDFSRGRIQLTLRMCRSCQSCH